MRTARAEARLCSRGIFVHRPLPPDHVHRVRRDHNLERRLSFDDVAMVHEFLVGTCNRISPGPKAGRRRPSRAPVSVLNRPGPECLCRASRPNQSH